MRKNSFTATLFVCAFLLAGKSVFAAPGGKEYTGQFDPGLIPNTEDFERVILKYSSSASFKEHLDLPDPAHFAAGRLIDPVSEQHSVLTLLVEEPDKAPVIYVDSDGDNSFSASEKYTFKPQEEDDPYLWNVTAEIKLKDGPFKTCPVFIRYFKSVQTSKMGAEDRLLTQSTVVMARGQIDVDGKKVAVQYAYDLAEQKVNADTGWLGMDIDGDGKIDMDNLSPEAAKADAETVVFRVGNHYLSTKKADVAKNQIILRENDAKDYKRVELYIGKDFPDFGFTDFDGKKHKFSEFHGKYVLLDIWGFWCPACRDELPYIREAYRRFQPRNLVILGLNTDTDFTAESIKKAMNESGMLWNQAQLISVGPFLRDNLRINSFPTTFLISPEGKLISMSRSERGEPDLRGKDLLETLDKTLPKQ
ncbi:MAG: TlpA family protein disulfide reductase [Pyrinomonadaceae bacterium]